MGHNADMGFKLGAFFGWGIVIYAVIFLVWSVFMAYGFADGWAPRLIGLLVLIFTSFIAGRSLRASTWHDILPYSLAWGAMMGVLDIILSVPFIGWQLFLDWNVWFGYAVVVLSPLLALNTRLRHLSGVPTSRL